MHRIVTANIAIVVFAVTMSMLGCGSTTTAERRHAPTPNALAAPATPPPVSSGQTLDAEDLAIFAAVIDEHLSKLYRGSRAMEHAAVYGETNLPQQMIWQSKKTAPTPSRLEKLVAPRN